MKFTVKELLNAGQHKWKEEEVDIVTLRNLEDLCRKLNKLGFVPPRNATSCLRSIKDQQRINPKAMGSSNRGSNCFLIARYSSTQAMAIIIRFFQPPPSKLHRRAIPESFHRSTKAWKKGVLNKLAKKSIVIPSLTLYGCP